MTAYSEVKRIFKEVALENTGYGEQEADAWAQGMIDALRLANPYAVQSTDAHDFAVKACKL